MNPMKLMQLKSAWDKFNKNHPKFTPFVKAVSAYGLLPDTVMEVNITMPDGKTFSTNLKVTPDDLELIDVIKGMTM